MVRRRLRASDRSGRPAGPADPGVGRSVGGRQLGGTPIRHRTPGTALRRGHRGSASCCTRRWSAWPGRVSWPSAMMLVLGRPGRLGRGGRRRSADRRRRRGRRIPPAGGGPATGHRNVPAGARGLDRQRAVRRQRAARGHRHHALLAARLWAAAVVVVDARAGAVRTDLVERDDAGMAADAARALLFGWG